MKFLLSLVLILGSMNIFANGLTPDQKKALDAQIEIAKGWGKESVIVEAVKAQNAAMPADYKDMNNDNWNALTALDPKVRNLSKNPVAEFIKSKKSDAVSEAFVNAKNGTKVALLSKTSSWEHSKSAKHTVPLETKNAWIGDVEKDGSTGVAQQIQISVPVIDGGAAIGSIVVGYEISKLK